MKEIEMMLTAKKAVEQVLALKPGEKVLVVTDTQVPVTIPKTLASAATAAGAETVVSTMITRKTHGVDPPETIAAAMLAADAVIMPTTYALTHTDAVRNALKSGTRFCNFREINEDMMVNGAVTADYNKVRETVDQLSYLIDKAETVTVTTPEGTDLKMKIAGRKALRLAGFAQEPGSLSGLPSGEAATAPLEGTTEGKIVNPFSMDAIGIIKDPFTLTIENGRVSKVEGGLEATKLRDIFANCDEFGTNIAEFAIGANPAARITGHIMEDKRRLGTVHIAVGDSMTLGGEVRSNIHYDILLFNPTVRMDDKLVVDNGSLAI